MEVGSEQYQQKRRQIRKELHELLSRLPTKTNSTQQASTSSRREDSSYLQRESITEPIVDNIRNRQLVLSPIESNNVEVVSLNQSLANWGVKHNITHVALTDLLKILQPHVKSLLPKCSKTLLGTPGNINICRLGGGKFMYFGLLKILKEDITKGLVECKIPIVRRLTSSFNFNDRTLLTICISTDGIPICKSSNTNFWPILIRLDQGVTKAPRLVALFSGESKPCNVAEFFSHFVDELTVLQNDGFIFENIHYNIKISCIIADAPARSFIKSVKGHNGHSGCERCEDVGDYQNKRMLFLELNSNLRDDNSFRAQSDSDHHKGISPLVTLDIGLVTQTVLDYMHLACLGVMRKLFYIWEKGPLPNRLSGRTFKELSAYLVFVSVFVPSEFARRPRSLNDLHRFKATEFRQFLLYVGPVALKKILPVNLYEHFLEFHTAIFILLTNKAHCPDWNSKSRALFKLFVSKMERFYGVQNMSYNVHSLIHLADDGINYGNLDNVSAFPFENYLQGLKRMVRGKTLELEQVCKRVSEREKCSIINTKVTKYHSVSRKGKFIKIYTSDNILISPKRKDCFFLLKSGEIIKVIEIISDVIVKCQAIKLRKSAEHYPINSAELGVFHVDISKFKKTQIINIENIVRKYVMLPISINSANHCICIPLVQMNI